MGIRLYPRTRDVATLEKLAGVPAGTAARLDEVKARHKEVEDKLDRQAAFDVGYHHWCEINDDPHLGKYDNFLLYGWGKCGWPACQGENGFGHCDDVETIKEIFAYHGIVADPALTGGVYWG